MTFKSKDFIIYLASVRFYHADVSEFLKQSDDGKVSLFLYRAVKGSRHRRLFFAWDKKPLEGRTMEVIRLTLLTQSPSCDSTKKEHWLEVTGCQRDTDIID